LVHHGCAGSRVRFASEASRHRGQWSLKPDEPSSFPSVSERRI
jgi:hypothetical protein